MSKRKIRAYKRKFRRFWREWGISFDEFLGIIAGFGVFVIPAMAQIVLVLLF